MIKPILVISALVLFGLSPLSKFAPSLQEPTPAPTPAPAPAPAALPAPAAAPNTMPNVKNPVKPTAESQARAKKQYGYDCLLCHGDRGDGKTDLAKDMGLVMSDLTNPTTLAGQTDQQIFEIIKKGKGKMPGEEGRAKDDELWNLVIYVRSLSKGQPAEAPKPTE
jgi:mono/diheme cytochrome c family protein